MRKHMCQQHCSAKKTRVHVALTFTLSYFGLKHIESTQATCHLTVPAPFLTVPAPFLTVPALSSRFTHGSPLCKRAVIFSYSNQFQRLAKQDLHFTCSRVFRFCWHVFVFLQTRLRFACPHACGRECCSCIIIIISWASSAAVFSIVLSIIICRSGRIA